MSVNKHRPHVLVLPEDDANRSLARGFEKSLDPVVANRFQVMPESNGWLKVLEKFTSEYAANLNRYPNRHVILLIDFDGKSDRGAFVKERIPYEVKERVYVLGAKNEPQDLSRRLESSFESIGHALALECRNGTNKTWMHAHLEHNAGELDRLNRQVRTFLFPSDS